MFVAVNFRQRNLKELIIHGKFVCGYYNVYRKIILY